MLIFRIESLKNEWGISKSRKIKHLQHIKSIWPYKINLNMWSCMLRQGDNLRNTISKKSEFTFPYKRFTVVAVVPRRRHNHTFGYPVYPLNNNLQASKLKYKWEPWSQIGIIIDPPPRRARTINMVLILMTGLLSKQFNINHN